MIGRSSPAVLLAATMLGAAVPAAAGPRAEERAWEAVQKAQDKRDDANILQRALAFLESFPDSPQAAAAHCAAADAAVSLKRWDPALPHARACVRSAHEGDRERHRLVLGLALAHSSALDEAAEELSGLGVSLSNEGFAATALRELASVELQAGHPADSLAALSTLIERGLFVARDDLLVARRAAQPLGEDGLEVLSSDSAQPLLAGLAGYLLLEQRGQLIDSDATEAARRDFAARFPEHPLLQYVARGEEFAAESEEVEPHKIGVLLPTSGKYTIPGQMTRDGIELALEQAESMGLPDLELIYVDSAGDPEQAVAGLRSLVQDHKVIAVLGPIISAEAERITEAIDGLRVPTVMMVQNPDLNERSPFLYNTWITPEEQVDAVATYAINHMGLERLAILYPAKRSGARMADLFWARAQELGAQVTAVEGYPPASTDFREIANRLKGTWYAEHEEGDLDLQLPFLPERSKPQLAVEGELVPGADFQAIFVPDNYLRIALMTGSLLSADINLGSHLPEEDFPPVTLLAGAAANHPDLVTKAERYSEGTVLVDGFFADGTDPTVESFETAFEARFERPPSVLEATAWDATTYLMQLLADGATTRAALRQRLDVGSPQRSVTGALHFDSNGTLHHRMLTLQVIKGAIKQIWPQLPAELPPTEGAEGEAPAEP